MRLRATASINVVATRKGGLKDIGTFTLLRISSGTLAQPRPHTLLLLVATMWYPILTNLDWIRLAPLVNWSLWSSICPLQTHVRRPGNFDLGGIQKVSIIRVIILYQTGNNTLPPRCLPTNLRGLALQRYGSRFNTSAPVLPGSFYVLRLLSCPVTGIASRQAHKVHSLAEQLSLFQTLHGYSFFRTVLNHLLLARPIYLPDRSLSTWDRARSLEKLE